MPLTKEAEAAIAGFFELYASGHLSEMNDVATALQQITRLILAQIMNEAARNPIA